MIDNGIGIAPEQQGNLFEMFWQAQGAGPWSEGGLGIGLALVKDLVDLHGRTVTAVSDGPGRGSTFTVRLPLRPCSPPAASDSTPAHEVPGAERALRVLLADDKRDAADSLGTLLRLSGYEVEVVHGGAEALERARRFRPDAVVLAIGMPDLDGYGVARLIRAEPWGADLRLIALTGWGREDDKRRARSAGFDADLTTPVELDELEAVLRA